MRFIYIVDGIFGSRAHAMVQTMEGLKIPN